MKPILATGSVVRNFLNSEVGAWPARPIDPSKPFQWQDRRPLNPQPPKHLRLVSNIHTPPFCFSLVDVPMEGDGELAAIKFSTNDCKKGLKAGDVLYVRETLHRIDGSEADYASFAADQIPVYEDGHPKFWSWGNKRTVVPSIHMPKELSRIHLKVMRVRVERAKNINGADAIAEGCDCINAKCFGERPFETLWKSIYGPDAWEKWVWVYDLKRIK